MKNKKINSGIVLAINMYTTVLLAFCIPFVFGYFLAISGHNIKITSPDPQVISAGLIALIPIIILVLILMGISMIKKTQGVVFLMVAYATLVIISLKLLMPFTSVIKDFNNPIAPFILPLFLFGLINVIAFIYVVVRMISALQKGRHVKS